MIHSSGDALDSTISRPILRSMLFVPANNSHRVDKALNLDADAVILDLEDAVALSAKASAREAARGALSLSRRPRLFVRVNALDTGLMLDDCESIVSTGLDGLVVPKVESALDVQVAAWLLGQLEHRYDLPPGMIELVALLETAAGIELAEEICGASSRLTRVAFGSIDFTLDIGVSHEDAAGVLMYARTRLVVACRAAGLPQPLDTVFPNVRDREGLEKDARLGRTLGFSGKAVIHPDQIETVNRVFSPAAAEVIWAQKVVAAFATAEAAGSSSIQVEGKFIDYPVATRARQVLEFAESLKAERKSDIDPHAS